jgi:enoyl-CoA hydratase/carnithine racemase
MPARIEFQQEQGLARVTLRYTQRFNAMSRAMWRDLRSIFERIGQSREVRCVLMSGHGDHFCAGGDISEYPQFRFSEADLREFHEVDVWGALQAMLACDVPIVAQIFGNCMGAGVEIASCCDIRLAAESARFGAPIARLGFPMAPREAALLGRELGLMTVRQMLLEAAIVSAPDLLQRGFLSRVVPDVELADLAQSTVQRIAALAPQAARLNKQTLRVLNKPVAHIQHASLDINSIALSSEFDELMKQAYRYADSPEHKEGICAFLEKRAPNFFSPPP